MARPFHWYEGASVEELTRQLVANPGARLEVHQDGQDMFLHVVPAGAVSTEGGGGGINESHICPPVCP